LECSNFEVELLLAPQWRALVALEMVGPLEAALEVVALVPVVEGSLRIAHSKLQARKELAHRRSELNQLPRQALKEIRIVAAVVALVVLMAADHFPLPRVALLEAVALLGPASLLHSEKLGEEVRLVEVVFEAKDKGLHREVAAKRSTPMRPFLNSHRCCLPVEVRVLSVAGSLLVAVLLGSAAVPLAAAAAAAVASGVVKSRGEAALEVAQAAVHSAALVVVALAVEELVVSAPHRRRRPRCPHLRLLLQVLALASPPPLQQQGLSKEAKGPESSSRLQKASAVVHHWSNNRHRLH
jgi:hypothetical protein